MPGSSSGHSAEFRPCRIETAPLEAVSAWADYYSHLWENRFDQLDAYVRAVQTDRLEENPT